MSIEVAAYVFDGTYTAEDALRKARAAEELNLVWIDDVAVIKRHRSGRLSIHSTWAQDDSDTRFGVGWGALTGGLIGAMAGPAGVLAGMLGGGAFGVLCSFLVAPATVAATIAGNAISSAEGMVRRSAIEVRGVGTDMAAFEDSAVAAISALNSDFR